MASSGRQTSARLIVARVAVLVVLLLFGAACRPEPALPTFGTMPEFSLVDQSGVPFSSGDLGQRVVLANFIFTSCVDTCPLLSATMGRVQEQLKAEGVYGSRTLLLSFSLDPERDTPAMLTAYGERFDVDHAGWRMLTGSSDAVGNLAQELKLGRPIPIPPAPGGPAINLAHSNRFVLVDPTGQVRGYYPGEELNVDEVVRDIRRLLRG